MRLGYNRTAAYLVNKLVVNVDVDLYPDSISRKGKKIVIAGTATFVLPGEKYPSKPYTLEVSEDGTVLKCRCSDPMHSHLIWMAAKARKNELADLISWKLS